jgi:preprotein translocase subunit SecA
MIEWTLKKVIGTKNERELKKTWPKVARINALEPKMEALATAELPAYTARLKDEVAKGRSLDDVLFEAFALVREAARRTIGQRHFDVQLIGGMFLHQGCIAEMRTGEGKTLTATLPAYLNALSGRGVHIVTVNDYLARRDAEWMGRVHNALGLTVGCIVHDLDDAERQTAYRADITYGQNNEFGFDYLRDNMKFRLQDYVQRELNYAIVDEVDSILIDEARTPLIISGPTEDSTDRYYQVDRVIPGMVPDQDYSLDEKTRSVTLTDAGVDKIQHRLNVANLYDPSEVESLHHVEQALRAHTLYKRDKDYVVKDGEVLIVDEFTGRLMPGRRWSDGLHQAIEAKEGVRIENENQTLATISFQNYFRMYSKLSGMTGTADTEAEEFAKIYNLDVRVVPTNRDMVRRDLEDVVYKTEREKFEASVKEIEELHQKGQPVLVGTVSIAKSEVVSTFLKRRGVPHNVLNAKQHAREADIVAQAGRRGSVTISTNMAGRGTDIVLGGNPEVLAKSEVGPIPEPPPVPADGTPVPEEVHRAAVEAWEKRFEEAQAKYKEATAREREEVVALGGLFILGTERHESRRIDNQLRGRAGRQGDPGVSKFYLSLEDDLMRIFGSERISGWMERLGMQEGEVIEHKWLSRSIQSAQKRVEGQNFDIRKNLLEYDDVMNQQRRTIYRLRRQVLAAGAGVALVEYEEDKKTKAKRRIEETITWERFREMVLDALEDVVMAQTDAWAPAKNPDSWDLEALGKAVKENLNLDMSFQADGSREDLQEHIFKAGEKALRAREEDFGEDFRQFARHRYLATIDALWKDHLLAMDHLRQGIGLRAYGQRDPKQAYKKEGYDGFVQMLSAINHQVMSLLMRIPPKGQAEEAARVEQQMVRAARNRPVIEGRGDAEGRVHAEAKPKAAVRTGPKVGRNDPCPCGSGKKYKKCHGAGDQPAK